MLDQFETRPRPIRRAAAICTAAASITVLGAPQALGAGGDETQAISSHSAELGTNQCKGASLSSVVNGAPGVPDDYDIYLSSPYSSCTARARFVGVASDGKTVVKTDFVAMRNGEESTLPVNKVYRCYIEFGVRRNDGTYYTRNLFPEQQENKNCPE